MQALAAALQGSATVRSLALTGLFVLACFYTLYLAREFFLPLVLALLLKFLLSPVVRTLRRWRVPEPLGAAVVLSGALLFLGVIVYQLSGPVAEWANRAPDVIERLQSKFRKVQRPLARVAKAGEEVGKMAGLPAGETPGSAGGEPLLVSTANLAFGAFVVLILSYFLLASGDLFLRKLIKVLPRFEDKKRAVEIAREVEINISTYLFTYVVINVALTAASTLGFWLIGLPNPLLWGVVMGVTNFVPYLGAIVTAAIVTVVAAGTFSSAGQILLAPAVSLGLNTLEGYIITPWIMGRRLTLNPVVIFVGLMFWGWLWGVAGSLLAVPILATLKIFCDRVEPLAPIGEFLGE